MSKKECRIAYVGQHRTTKKLYLCIQAGAGTQYILVSDAMEVHPTITNYGDDLKVLTKDFKVYE